MDRRGILWLIWSEDIAKSIEAIGGDFRDFPANGGKMIDSSEKTKLRDAKSRYQRRYRLCSA